MIFIIMGVAGSGKTTLGQALAKELNVQFLDADDFHSNKNILKMESGVSLTDDDRLPWLESINAQLRQTPSVVLACSALKKKYRDILTKTLLYYTFIFLDVEKEVIVSRIKERRGHFFPVGLIDSQFSQLEVPTKEESSQIVYGNNTIDKNIKLIIGEIERDL